MVWLLLHGCYGGSFLCWLLQPVFIWLLSCKSTTFLKLTYHRLAIISTVLIIEFLLTMICSMSNQRSELAEMTALYLIPIVSVVIAATSGGLVAGVLPNQGHQLWTLIICYILWGIGSPLSWIILTLYFLRMTVHKPLKREVIVSLLLPIGPLGLSGFSWDFSSPSSSNRVKLIIMC